MQNQTNNQPGGLNPEQKKEPDKINERLQGSRFDKILRENMPYAMPGITEKVLKLNIVSTQELKDKIQITRQKEVDVLRIVTDTKGDKYILHLEFESKNKVKMNYRMGEYRCMLHQIHDYPIKQYVIYMGKAAMKIPSRIDLPGLKFEYTLIDFSKLPYKMFLSSDEPEEQILAALANFGDEGPTIALQEILKKLGKGSSEELEGNKYYNQLRVLIQMRNLDEPIKKAMEHVNTFFKKERDVLYKWGKEEGMQLAKIKAEEEKKQIAVEMKRDGISIDQIIKYTKLSVNEIEGL